jgi:hypothetical protein
MCLNKLICEARISPYYDDVYGRLLFHLVYRDAR